MPGTPKQFNTHKYPNANHQPRQKAADRKLHAQARQDVYNELTLEQKIAALPPEPYSKKQRARLLAKLAQRNQPKPEPQVTGALTKGDLTIVVGETTPSKPKQQKKYMKGAK
jgi:hypothetical protein